MVMKSFIKTVLRSFKSNFAKLISITFIILLGVAFIAGLGTLSPTIEQSFNESLIKQNVSDLVVKSTSPKGFSKTQIQAFKDHELISDIQAFTMIDLSAMNMDINGKNTRMYVLPEENSEINKLKIIDGRLPLNKGEIAVERASRYAVEHSIGESISYFGRTFKVVGIVGNPLIFDRDGEPDTIKQKPLEEIFYITKEVFADYGNIFPEATDIYVRLNNTDDRDIFSRSYKKHVEECVQTLQEDFGDGFVYLTLEDCKSVAILDSYCDKVTVITLIFPIFFILVVALVVMTTMTRMVEEERGIIGCYKTLGVSDAKIIFKYVFLASLCSLLAFGIGMGVGLTLLPSVIFSAFKTLFFLPAMSVYVQPAFGIVSFLAMFIVVIGVTVYVVNKNLNTATASLLTPKSPKAGKKIILEKIPFIWNKMSFKYKSCFRNILRYVNHLFMTVISVAGATALVFAGFGLLNVTSVAESGPFAGIIDTIAPIAVVVIIFALLLCVFVIYNLTNMNIGERKREIATLKVLGYRDIEVIGYMYREILIMAIIGIVIGLLLGCGLMYFVLTYLEFGVLSDVKWYTYFATAGIITLFIGIVDVMLIPKILKIDMTTSLKSIE